MKLEREGGIFGPEEHAARMQGNIAKATSGRARFHRLDPDDDPNAAKHNAAHRSYESLRNQLETLTESAEEAAKVTTGKSVVLTYSDVAGAEVVRSLQVLKGSIYDTNRNLQPEHQFQH